jgi:hypothetical protein
MPRHVFDRHDAGTQIHDKGPKAVAVVIRRGDNVKSSTR